MIRSSSDEEIIMKNVFEAVIKLSDKELIANTDALV
jgi:hypothetical protein